MKNNKIDFVITWVDGFDEKWQKEKQHYLKTFLKENKNSNKNFYNQSRYRDFGTLKYWFRGIEKYAPWVNKIYFVTCGQVPDWLNLDNEKLVLMNHKDFIPKEYLPTFSSDAIEVNLHRIKELSENFVVFNDDMFIIDKVKESDFFVDDKPCDAAVLGIVPMDENSYANFNNTIILNKYFNKKEVLKNNKGKWFNLKYRFKLLKTILLLPYKNFVGLSEFHICYPLKKSTFNTLWKLEKEAFETTAFNKFRNRNNINIWLLKNYQICTGNFVPRNVNFGKSFTILNDQEVLEAITKQKYKVVCINDDDKIEEKDWENKKQVLIEAFESILPDKSSFEK